MKRVLSTRQRLLPKFSLGERGEQRALAFLQKRGYEFLAANVRIGNKELDLVVFDPEHQEVVFVEVKTRSSTNFGNPHQAIGYKKLSALRTAATAFLNKSKLEHDYRFDSIAVLPGTIRHYQDITCQ
ncbi:MAG: YraN family protein [Patescibacteria group bacterium]